MKLLYEKKLLVHFGDADPQGILYFSKISQWAHELIEEYWADSKLGWSGWFQSPEFAVPLRHTEQDFFAPMLVGTELKSQLYVSEISESSVRFKVDFLTSNNVGEATTPSAQEKIVSSKPIFQEKLAATAQSVHVFVDRVTFKKISVPPEIRNILN
jgi:1,4-dihydroxy-2-naphthoyl-CoA hydrolase